MSNVNIHFLKIQKYETKEPPLQWFIENLFLNKMINDALQMKDINQLYTLRYFLADLMEHLIRKHQ